MGDAMTAPDLRWDDPTTWRVIVTGGASGLGAATCTALARAGASVTALDVHPTADVPNVEVDLADRAAAERATATAIERMGGVTAVVCCAGIDRPGPFEATDGDTWDRIVAVNLLGTAAVVRAAAADLERVTGRVVTVASTLGHRTVGDATAYCASKFGVVGFTRALTAEYRGRLGVTLLTPGGMRTPFFDDRDECYQPGPDAALADPDDIAEAIVWTLARPAGIEVRELAIMSPGESSWP
jgi:NAD(P)-dependent dehydrogenase (short-subunit alcohol dehydrogenase family)